ncbi:MAG: four helix bundle protein [Verrucomicrobiaceae bacterium]
MNSETDYDLEDRLLEYAARIIRLSESLTGTQSKTHISKQLLRSGTAALAHHGEAQAAESNKDFIHKLKIGLKELRETTRWLKLIHRVPLVEKPNLIEPLIQETDELERIFAASIRTLQARLAEGEK